MDVERLFSDRAKRMKASEIRELLKLTQRSDIISFAGGLPNPLTFPIQDIEKACVRVLKEEPELALQYGTTEGYAPLRHELAAMMKKDGSHYSADHFLITNGSQQGLDLLGKVFLNQGDKVLVSNPTYLGALSAFNTYNCEYVAVSSDREGMRVDALEETLVRLKKRGERAKFLYTVPTFMNPTGTVMPAARRRKVLDLAHEHDILVVEDDPYGKLRFDGDAVPLLASMDKEDRVVYLGTFSKILVPGFRLAWAAGPEAVVRKMVIAKQAVDLCTNAYTQFVTADLMKDGLIDRHLPKIISLYRKKRDIMLKTMEATFPKENTSWTRSQGGLFSWAELPMGVDTEAMLNDAIAAKVAYVPGRPFHIDGTGKNTMRLNFSHPTDEKVKEGVERLAAVVNNAVRKLPKQLA